MEQAWIFDSHAHYDDEAFQSDRETLLASLPEAGVCGVINCGCDLTSSQTAISYASRYPFIYAAAGFHPEMSGGVTQADLLTLEQLLTAPKVVAIGEIGLDYHYDDGAPRSVQMEVLAHQLELANMHGLPVIIHDRDAHADTLALLRQYRPKGVVHCFSGSVELAREVVGLGMYIGLGGAVTFKNARKPVEVAAYVPDDRLLIETDCPYMAPIPFRGKRNDSTRIPYTAQRLAEIRATSAEEILRLTCENAHRLFL